MIGRKGDVKFGLLCAEGQTQDFERRPQVGRIWSDSDNREFSAESLQFD